MITCFGSFCAHCLRDELIRGSYLDTFLKHADLEMSKFHWIFFRSRIHKPRDSLFSWSSNFNDFSGLVNWGFLLLTMGGIRLLLENFIKYGFRVDPMQWFIVLTGRNEGDTTYPSIVLGLCKNGFCSPPAELITITWPCRFFGSSCDMSADWERPVSGKLSVIYFHLTIDYWISRFRKSSPRPLEGSRMSLILLC